MTYSNPIINEPTQTATHAVIWLHGLGADGHDFANLVPMLKLPASHRIRFVFPHARTLPVTLNGGYEMPSWYDIKSADFADRADEQGMQESVDYLHRLIEEQHQSGVAYQNILLAGFSQGGAVVLQAGCNFKQPLNAVIALSTYVAITDKIPKAQYDTPIFMAHGTQDAVVPFAIGQQSCALLEQQAYPVSFHQYPMEHAVCEQEIQAISQFITERTT